MKELKIKYHQRFSYPEKYEAKSKSQIDVRHRKPGMVRHHWSYNTEHQKDVIELSSRDHKKIHRYLSYDREKMMYRRKDNGILLNTRQSHIEFIIYIVNNMPDNPGKLPILHYTIK